MNLSLIYTLVSKNHEKTNKENLKLAQGIFKLQIWNFLGSFYFITNVVLNHFTRPNIIKLNVATVFNKIQLWDFTDNPKKK